MHQLSRITGATIDVLSILESSREACWGLAIIKASGRPAGSVYPILDRLETAGWVTSNWEQDASRPGPRRRYYELTTDGAAAAHLAIREFEDPARRSANPKAATT